MRLKDAPVFTGQRDHRNGFGRGESEIVKYPPIGRSVAVFDPCRVDPLRQGFTRGRMLIFAEPQKIIRADFPRQAKPFHAQPIPVTRHPLALVVIVADAKMLLKVFPGVLQIVLRLGRDHTQTLSEPAHDFLQLLQVRTPLLW